MSPPAPILDTILSRLALLFIEAACGDKTAARLAASQMLAAYNAETEDELSLAAEIISFRFHTLEALSYASGPELSVNNVLRFRGSAVSLSRESHKAQRKLDQLQRARKGVPQQPPAETHPVAASEPILPRPRIDNAMDLLETAREAVQAATKTGGKMSWSQAFQKRQLAKRIAENSRKNQARHLSQTAHVASSPSIAPGAGASI